MEIFEEVKRVVVDQLGVDPEKVEMKAKFIDDLGADSLDIVEMIMRLEELLGIEIPDEDVEGKETIGDMVNYLAGRLQ